MKKFLLLIILTVSFLGSAQQIGDYRSIGNGNWNAPKTWQYYDGNAWGEATTFPGSNTSPLSGEVTIQPCHIVTGSIKYTYGNITKLIIKGQLKLTKNRDITFSAPLQDVIIDGGAIFWSDNPSNLYLPLNCGLSILNLNSTACAFPKGLQPVNGSSCVGSQRLYIGGALYSTCQGGAGQTNFDNINDVGGTLMAAPGTAPNNAICSGTIQPIQLVGNAIQYGASLGTIDYSWAFVSGPQTINVANNARNITITPPSPLPDGDYVFNLTVSIPGFSNSREITFSVGMPTEYLGSGIWTKDRPTSINHRPAIISGSYNTLAEGSLDACSCQVNAGGSLTIDTDTYVSLLNGIDVDPLGQVVLKTGGNLLQTNEADVNTGEITAERYVTDMNNSPTQMDYVYWSSPVSGQGLQAFSPGTPISGILRYNEPNDRFVRVNLATESEFIPGKGYAFRAEGGLYSNPYAKTYQFTGKPNNGLVQIPVQRTANTGTVEHGHNLIGNPYPSSIDINQFCAMNSSVIYRTAWFWTNNFYTATQMGSSYNQNNYAIWSGVGGVAATVTGSADNNPSNSHNNITKPTAIVPVGQGFIVKVKESQTGLGPMLLNFRNKSTINGVNIRVATSGTFFNKEAEQKDRFWVKLISPEGIINSQLIGYVNGATNGYEPDYDAELMSMSSDAFYSLLEDRKLQIQGKGAFDQTDQVKLGANIFKNGTYTIAMENQEGIFNGGQKVYLRDHLLNRWVDLSTQTYTFEATKGITEGRFEVLYQPQATPMVYGIKKDGILVYRDGAQYVIRSPEKISLLEVYDGAGRMVYAERPGKEEVSVNSELYPKGVFFFKIYTVGSVIMKKVLH